MSSRYTSDTNILRIRDVFAINPQNSEFIQPGEIPMIGLNGQLRWYSSLEFFSSISVPTASTNVLGILLSVPAGLSSLSTAITTGINDAITSTVAGLGSADYVSTSYLENVITLLSQDRKYISATTLYDVIANLGNLPWIGDNGGPMALLGSNFAAGSGYISTFSLFSTVIGLGSSGYLSTSAFQAALASTVVGLGTTGYVSTAVLQSTVEGLGTAGFISTTDGFSIHVPVVYTSSIFASSVQTSSITTVSMMASTISTYSMVVYGNSTLTVEGGFFTSTLNLRTPQGTYAPITISSGYLNIGGFIPSTIYSVTPANIISTVAGLGASGYVSSSGLASTVCTLLAYISSFIDPTEITSTVIGLATSQYVSTTGLFSTVTGLGQFYVSTSGLVSTTSNIVATNLPSTIAGLGTLGYVSTATDVTSSIRGLGTSGYISTQQLVSTTIGLSNYISTFIDTTELTSTVMGLATSQYVSTTGLFSTVQGLGSAGYVSSLSLVSTTSNLLFFTTSTIVSTTSNLVYQIQQLYGGGVTYTQLASTTAGLGTTGYLSTSGIISSFVGLGSLGYVSSTQLFSTTNSIAASNLPSTVAGLGTSRYVSSLSNVLSLSTQQIHTSSLSSFYINTGTLNSGGLTVAGATNVRELTATSNLTVNSTITSCKLQVGKFVVFPETTNGYTIAQLDGGNNWGYIFADFQKLGDGINLSYNYVASNGNAYDGTGTGTALLANGAAMIKIWYGQIGLFTGTSDPLIQALYIGKTSATTIRELTVTSNITVNSTLNANRPMSFADITSNPLNGKCQIQVESASQTLYIGTGRTVGTGSASIIQSSDFYSGVDHGANLYINLLGGNVGIGTSTPTATLDVNGTLNVTGAITTSGTVAIGLNAGQTSQQLGAVAIGYTAGQTIQGTTAVAIGSNAGNANQGISAVAIGTTAGQTSQDDYSVAIGYLAGQTNQSTIAVAIGYQAGNSYQGYNTVAIGNGAGRINQCNTAVAIGTLVGENYQGDQAVAIGVGCGRFTQSTNSIAIGTFAGYSNQDSHSIAIGAGAANRYQGSHAVAIGTSAGYFCQGGGSVVIGSNAGYTNNSLNTYTNSNYIAIGRAAGYTNQGISAVAIGDNAGQTSQNNNSVAIGRQAGEMNQSTNSVAVGYGAGNTTQGHRCVGIGVNAGCINQGNGAIAIGVNSGYNGQPSDSISIYASTSGTFTPGNSGLYVVPVRNVAGATSNTLTYNTISGEISWGTPTSDLKLKENIHQISSCLDTLANLRPVQYNFKTEPSSFIHYGFIAQEVEPHFPNMISRDSLGTFGIQYDMFHALTINATQSLNSTVKGQDSKLSTLTSFYDTQAYNLSSLTSSYELLTQQEVSTQLMMSTLSGQQKQINDLAETVSSLVAKVGL